MLVNTNVRYYDSLKLLILYVTMYVATYVVMKFNLTWCSLRSTFSYILNQLKMYNMNNEKLFDLYLELLYHLDLLFPPFVL